MSTHLLTVTEFAERLRVSRSTAYELIAAAVAAGELAVVDVGTGKSARTRISEEAFAAYVAARTRKAS